MGYTTDFDGCFYFSRDLTIKEKNELDDIANKDWRDDDERPDIDSYYCQWISNEDGTALQWDGGEKFYGYINWLKWLIDEFFKPRGIILNGEVLWHGEDFKDIGKIIVKDNILEIKEGKIDFR